MRVVVVDDDEMIVSSLKIILEAQPDAKVVGFGGSADEAIELYESLRPDVLLIDIRMKEKTGLEAAEVILKRYPDALILFLTTFTDDEYVVRALRMGAKGYLLKQDFAGIYPSLKAVCSGQSVFGGDIVGKLPVEHKTKKDFDYRSYDLSDKEWNLIREIAEGYNNKEISQHLFLSEGTVRNYISLILEKLQLRDRTQIAVFYYKNV